MRVYFLTILIFPLILLAAGPALCAAERPQTYNPCNKSDYSYAGEDPTFANPFMPGVPWPAVADLMNAHWNTDQLSNGSLYSVKDVQQAIDWAAVISEPADDEQVRNDSEHYQPSSPATSAQQNAYETAAKLYHDGEWGPAIQGLDKIVADKSSPYRAAAAYSAARAALNQGDYPAALGRIQSILSDPALAEFHLATLHLIGTRADQVYDPRLFAAHYAEIAYLLKAPPTLMCHNAVAQEAYGKSGRYRGDQSAFTGDLETYLDASFPQNYPSFVYGERRQALDALAAHDPFFDILKAMAAPTPYLDAWNWPAQYNHRTSEADKNSHIDPEDMNREIADEEALTRHARDEWRETKNILWGYVLAQRTGDPADLPAVQEMLASLPNLPRTDAVDYARAALSRHFVRHAARLMLMNSQVDAAIEFARQNRIETIYPAERETDANILLNGGIRYLLEKLDLANARKWASEVGATMPETQIDDRLSLLLANSYNELLDGKVPGDRTTLGNVRRDPSVLPLEVMDFQSAQSLLDLSDHQGLDPRNARTLLASGWLRTYLLKGTPAAIDLLPGLRGKFPELATDIDDILDTHGTTAQDRLITRLLLRTPGITLRPSWTNASWTNAMYWTGRQDARSIFAINDQDPSDGNWWCAADLDQMKIEMVKAFYISSVGLSQDRNGLYVDPVVPFFANEYGQHQNDKAELLKFADKVIAWHPLLKDAAMSELTALSKVECGPRLLSEKALAWAKASNWFSRKLGYDKYLPETLHLAVRSTRYGCRRDGSLADVSRQTFAELHRLYPKSSWAQQTPYWFDAQKISQPEDQNVEPKPSGTPQSSAPQPRPLKAKIKDALRPVWRWWQSL